MAQDVRRVAVDGVGHVVHGVFWRVVHSVWPVAPRVWNVVFIVVAVVSALVAARYYVVGVLARDRPLARAAAAMFFVFTIAAVLYLWRFV